MAPGQQALYAVTAPQSSVFHSGPQKKYKLLKAQLGFDFQVNKREASSRVAWEGLPQLRSQVPVSADGSLEALITGTLSELLLPQWKTWASFQGSC